MNVSLGISGAALFIGTSSWASLTAGFALIEIGRQSLTLMKSVLADWLVPDDQEEEKEAQDDDESPLLGTYDFDSNHHATGDLTGYRAIQHQQLMSPISQASSSEPPDVPSNGVPQRNTLRAQKRLVGFGFDVLLEAAPKLFIGPFMHHLLQLEKQGSWCWPYILVAAASTLALVLLLVATWLFAWPADDTDANEIRNTNNDTVIETEDD
ncbi:hypothetical protein ACHAQH_008809 [Verticillium albo-atrum]